MFWKRREESTARYSILEESEHYIVYRSDFQGPRDVLEIAEELKAKGVKVLSFGVNGGIFCEKENAKPTDT